jgi:MbtH protein
MNEPTEPQWRVVVNDEEQYALWPAYKDNARGWRDTGVSGSRAACLAHVRAVWTDLTPRSLRTEVTSS